VYCGAAALPAVLASYAFRLQMQNKKMQDRIEAVMAKNRRARAGGAEFWPPANWFGDIPNVND
jgi:hypothetical protein